MNDALKRLRKILELEQQYGYNNKSVIGGLERLREHWLVDAGQKATGAAQRRLVQEIAAALSGYASLPGRQERKQAVDRVLSLIDRWPTEAAQPGAPAVPAPEAPRATEAAPARSRPAAPPLSRPTPAGAASLRASVSRLPGVGPGYTKRLAMLGVHTIGDLLWLLPRRYNDYESLKSIHQLRQGEEVTIVANLWDLKRKPLRGRNAALISGILGDSTATIQVTWFNPYMFKKLRVGQTYVISGRVDSYLGRLVLRNPEVESVDREQIHTGRLAPVYPLTKGVSDRWLRNLQKQAVDNWASRLHDYLPEEVRQRAGLLSLSEALAQVHFPDNWESLREGRRRLAFDELFLIQIGMLRQRQAWFALPAQPMRLPQEAHQAFLGALPFQFTGAQARVTEVILSDLAQARPMSRLLQGDVGSGKTAVAAMAMWAVSVDGAQAAMMAPTEILAEQHFRKLSDLFGALAWQGRTVRVALLTGSQKAAQRAETLAALATGQVDIVVGTHALIQRGVQFHNLGLVIIDEQHRFGVRQRATLRQKGIAPEEAESAQAATGQLDGLIPHVLVMSATPIPRTLSLTIFGDLDVSVIDEMPPGRQPIKTRWLLSRERERAYAFVRRQIEAGRQAFIIYPLVEESEALDAQAAVPEYERLCREVFPDLRLGLVHGRLKNEEKDAVMQAMRRGEIDILVATSVVEVGIDIPNATVIVIENAERFGLAQLHQFRGRVGRGEHASYCILISGATSATAAERLRALEDLQDGFALAEKDLALRGPGDFFGVRQSGLPDLKLAQLSDLRTLEQARAEATRLLESDPDLSQPQHLALARKAQQFWQGEGDVS